MKDFFCRILPAGAVQAALKDILVHMPLIYPAETFLMAEKGTTVSIWVVAADYAVGIFVFMDQYRLPCILWHVHL